MKPSTNRAAQRKPCKKQAFQAQSHKNGKLEGQTSDISDKSKSSSSFYSSSISSFISNFRNNSNNQRHNSSSESTQNIMQQRPFHASPRRVRNPYAKVPKSFGIPSHIRDILNQDTTRKETKQRMLSSCSDTPSDESSDDSSFSNTSVDSSLLVGTYNLRRARRFADTQSSVVRYHKRDPRKDTHRVLMSSSTEEDPSLSDKVLTSRKAEVSSESSSIQSVDLNAANFDVNVVREALNIFTQNNKELSKQSEVQNILHATLSHCRDLELTQKEYRMHEQKQSRQFQSMKQSHSNLLHCAKKFVKGHQNNPTLYQQVQSSSSDSEENVSSVIDEALSFQSPVKSKFTKLNINSDGDTYVSGNSEECSSSTPEPKHCPIEEISSPSDDDVQYTPTVRRSNTRSESVTEATTDSLIISMNEDLDKTEESSWIPHTVELDSAEPLPRQSAYDDPTIKSARSVRILSQNCRGVYTQGQKDDERFVPAMESFKSICADIVLLSETNVDWKVNENMWHTQLLNKAIWKPNPTKTVMSSCTWDNKERTSFQTGGVMSVFLNQMPSRILSIEHDKYGRWTRTSLQLKEGALVVYNTYRTHKKTLGTAGIDTPWMHQWMAMGGGQQDVDPRSKHMSDLEALVEDDASEGNMSIIMGDFNEDLGDTEKGGLALFETSPHLINAFLHFNGKVPSSRGNTRSVCHVYISPGLIPFISKIGICSDNDGFDESDHIPFFMDLDEKLFTSKMHKILPQTSRILQMYDAVNVEKYVHSVLVRMESHNIQGRLEKLRNLIRTHGFGHEAQIELEKIDSQVSFIRLHAEKTLMRTPTRYKHTDIAKNQVQRIRLLKKLNKQYKKGLPISNTLARLEHMEFLVEITPDTLPDIITQEKQELKRIQNDIDSHREMHLDKIHEKMALEKNKEVMQIVSEMKQREKQKRSWRKISFATKKRGQGVSRLGIPEGFENAPIQRVWEYLQDPYVKPKWVYITDPDTIAQKLTEWQKFHYHQAHETPFATWEWNSNLNPCVLEDEDILANLNGGWDTEELHPSSKLFLEEITNNIIPQMPAEATNITEQKFRSFYSKTPEKTSSSPSGLHMGHWKAAATNSDISKVLVSIMSIALANSYPLKRWKKVMGVLLEKKEGQPLINKFRTIHIIESDLNFIMRSMWGRELMKWSESHGAIHNNQYGGRKGVQAQSAATNKTVTCDVIRYYAEDATLIDNDAQACYDRIVPAILVYALLRLGVPTSLVKFQCKWLEEAIYELKLGKGRTDATYTHQDSHPLYGTGQGTGWSPPSWTALSDLISRVMEKYVPGLKIVHPDGSFVRRILDAFVDDVNSGLTNDAYMEFKPSEHNVIQRASSIIEQTQRNMQIYSQLLFSTGGKLALQKCAVYLLVTAWKEGRRSYKPTHITHNHIKIKQGINQDQQKVNIENPKVARRMLGVYVSPAGNSDLQYNILRQKSLSWATKMRSQSLHSFETLMSYRQGIMKSLEYPLGASLLSRDQCYKIQSPALLLSLQKNGVVSTIARDLVFGPHRYGCLQYKSLYTELGIQKIELYLGHVRRNDKTGSLLKIALGCMQQEVGISKAVLASDFLTYESITSNSWMKHLWKFLCEIGGKIRHINEWTPSKVFEYDINIMEEVMSWENISYETKYRINMCRLHKRCYFIGDLLNPSGTKFMKDALSITCRGFHTDKFPNTVLPKKFEEAWRFAIRHIVQNKRIGKGLGKIVNISSKEWSLDASKLFLIRKIYGQKSILFFRKGRNRYEVQQSSLNVPVKAVYYASVEKKADTYLVTSTGMLYEKELESHLTLHETIQKIHIPSHPITEDDLNDSIQLLPEVYKRNVGKIQEVQSITFLAHQMTRGRVIAVSDATYDKRTGAHSFILENKSETAKIIAAGPVDTDMEDGTSNRTEGCAVIAIMTVAMVLQRICELQNATLEIYCDNQEALRVRNLSTSTYTNYVKRDVDLQMEVSEILNQSFVKFTFHHVQGHADDSENFVYAEASQQTRRNIDMDENAALFLSKPPSTFVPNTKPHMFLSQKLALYLQDSCIVGDLKKQIHLHHNGHNVEKRLAQSLAINESDLEKIEWEGIDAAFKKLSDVMKASRMKIAHKYLPTRSVLHSRDGLLSAQCPRCDRSVESFAHVLQCKCRENKSAHNTLMKKFRNDLRRAGTHILLVNAFDMIITQFHQNKKFRYVQPELGEKKKLEVLKQVFEQQQALGRDSFVRGFISRNWMVAQNICEQKTRADKKDLAWLKRVIQAIWTYVHGIWVQRCKHINIQNKDDPANLTHLEIKFAIRQYLKMDKTHLSGPEKLLHLNVSRNMGIAHTKTLIKWLRLLAKERAATVRRKREGRTKRSQQTLTRFFTSAKRRRQS